MKKDEAPLDSTTLATREQIPPTGDPVRTTVQLLDLRLDGLSNQQLSQQGKRMLVTADVGVDGVDVLQPFQPPTLLKLNRDLLAAHLEVAELDGISPIGVTTRFSPNKAPVTHCGESRLPPRRESDRDLGGTIFDTDDRYLFHDTSFPWRIIGKVRTAGGWGSGTIIGPRHILTASHVVNWTTDDAGNIGWITFTPGYFDGRGPWGELRVNEVIWWEQAPGSLTDEQTAFDYVVLVTDVRIGDSLGYAGARTYSDSWNGGTYWQYTGYPGELASGERPAFQGSAVVSSKQDFTLNGNQGYVLGHFNEFTPGQSGGAAWGWWNNEPWPRVIGVGSTIGSTAVQKPTGSTTGDNEYGGGPALTTIISWARTNRP